MKCFPERYVRLHQMCIRQGDPVANTTAILGLIARARADGVRLAVFPELAVTGILSAPEWQNDFFHTLCEECLDQILAATQGIAVILGAALRYRGSTVGVVMAAEDGRRVNPAGAPVPFVPKHLSGVNRFDAVGGHLCAGAVAGMEGVALSALAAPFIFRDFTVGAWVGQADSEVIERFAQRNVDLLLCLDTLPYVRNRPAGSITGGSVTGVPFARCGSVGVVDAGKTLFVLAGGTVVEMPDAGKARAPLFVESILDFPESSLQQDVVPDVSEPRRVIQALETACRAQLERLGLKRVIVGASGGIDSALTAALYSRVAGPDNLLLVNMPSRHNSMTTISLARQLAANLGCYYTEAPIEESVRFTQRQIQGLVCERPGVGGSSLALSLSSMALENVQARDRSGRVLAALCSAFGGVFTCNANKSESTVGYGTMYGDIAGFFAALADLWKIEVWEIARCYNSEVFGRAVIPQGSIDLVPSAELGPDQNVDEKKGDPLIYPWHDRLFAAWTERTPSAAPEDVLDWYASGTLSQETGYEGDIRALFPDARLFCQDLEKMWRLYNGLARAKRLQAPPVLSLKNRTYGFDLGTAQLPVFFSPRYGHKMRRMVTGTQTKG